jgi:hypothetical protein
MKYSNSRFQWQHEETANIAKRMGNHIDPQDAMRTIKTIKSQRGERQTSGSPYAGIPVKRKPSL